ncbi:MAG TPA: hypothetical protein ENK98_05060 [Epsilonproteobacteria bacterium]|nr:hypothetical protein [Campylobacterota bacterium]
MAYFAKAKIDRKVYDLIFGKGKIIEVYPDSHYTMMVEFKNDYQIAYTEEGLPNWGNFKEQTLFYKKDIDLTSEDFSPVQKILSSKKIIKLRDKNKLEVRMPSGIWKSTKRVEDEYVEKLLKKEKYHFFRKKKS